MFFNAIGILLMRCVKVKQAIAWRRDVKQNGTNVRMEGWMQAREGKQVMAGIVSKKFFFGSNDIIYLVQQ